MKHKNLLCIVSGLALIALALFTGCVTTPQGHHYPDPTITRAVAQDAALVTGDALKGQYRTELGLTAASLDSLVAIGGGSVDDLRAALSKLPVSSLVGTNGSIAVSDGAVLLTSGGSALLSLDKSEISTYYVLPIATGLAAGLHQALGD